MQDAERSGPELVPASSDIDSTGTAAGKSGSLQAPAARQASDSDTPDVLRERVIVLLRDTEVLLQESCAAWAVIGKGCRYGIESQISYRSCVPLQQHCLCNFSYTS